MTTRHLSLALPALLAAACATADTEAPQAPVFDGPAEATRHVSPATITGVAEFGATVHLTRDPAFAAGEAPADAVADAFRAAFRFDAVPLVKGKNTFTATATDAAGNKGPAGTLVVSYDEAPESVEVSLSTRIVASGDGKLVATARIRASEAGFKLDGHTVTFRLGGVGSGQKTAVTDAKGVATAEPFSGFVAVGAGTVSASVEGLEDSTDFAVIAGAPTKLSLTLAKEGAAAAGTKALTLRAGESAVASVTVQDDANNPVSAPIQLFTDAPGAFVAGNSLSNLHAVGAFRVVAVVTDASTGENVAVSDTATLTVTPGAPASLRIELASAAAAGEALPFAVQVLDAWGNVVTPASTPELSVTTTDAKATVGGAAVTFKTAGTQAVEATLHDPALQEPLVAEHGVAVAPGPAALVGIDVGQNAVKAGEVPTVLAQAKDAFGNTLAAAPTISVVPKAGTLATPPGPVVSGGKIYNLVRPGAYLCIAEAGGITNDLGDPEATITVSAAAPAKVDLRLSRAVAEVGSAVDFAVATTDAYGNDAGAPATVSVTLGTTVVAASVTGTSFTAPAPGSYTLTATVGSGATKLVDSKTLVVTAPVDTDGPTIAFQHPQGDPTTAAWPVAAGQIAPTICADGDSVEVTVSDPSLVASAWVTFGGLYQEVDGDGQPQPNSPKSFGISVPQASASSSRELCASQVSGTRGEILATVSALDARGNFRAATASWCLDPDAAAGYGPASTTLGRCVVAKQRPATLFTALAASPAGDLAAARQDPASGAAYVGFFGRATSPYGFGNDRALANATNPRGIAFTGNTILTSVSLPTAGAISRLSILGGGTSVPEDAFVSVEKTVLGSDRFEGLAIGADGALYVAASAPGAFAGKVYRFAQPTDRGTAYTALPAPWATVPNVRLAGLCAAPAGGFYATGYVQSGSATFATLGRLDGTGYASVWTDNLDGRVIGGCAATAAGVAVSLQKQGSNAGLVTLVDPAAKTLASSALVNAYGPTALEKPAGLAVTQGYLFATTTEGGNLGSVLRVARPGGF